MEASKLNERGFVSIIGNRPYWITRNQANQVWLYIFDTKDKRWVTVRQLTEADINVYFAHHVRDEVAQLYHNGNHANLLYGKEPEYEIVVNEKVISSLADPDLGKYKNSIITGISNATSLDELKTTLFDSIGQLNELN